MAYAVLAAALTAADVQLPALSLPLADRPSAGRVALPIERAPLAPQQHVAAPTPAVPAAAAPTTDDLEGSSVPATVPDGSPATLAAERSAVAQSAGTLAFVMRQSFDSGPYPPSITVGMTGPERIMLADGTGLAAVPDGARVLYSTSADRSAWSVTILGARFGAVASYSSAVGTVEVG